MTLRSPANIGLIVPTRRHFLLGGLALLSLTVPAGATDLWLDELWRCGTSDCPGYTYDPRRGDEVFDIPANTPFQKLPEDWVCPRCGSAKSGFYFLEMR